MRIIRLLEQGGANTIPDFLRDVNRRDRIMLISDAEYASIPTSGVMGDEIEELSEDLLVATSVTVTSATDAIGYATGAGGAVTQITSASTGVTLSKPCGQITTVALTTAAAAEEAFVVTNTLVDANDVIAVSTTYAGAGKPIVFVTNVGAGVFTLNITNVHAANALDAVLIINFALIKSVAA